MEVSVAPNVGAAGGAQAAAPSRPASDDVPANAPKTEFADQLAAEQAKNKPTDEKPTSIGDQLNHMAGVQTKEDLYKTPDKMGKDTFLKMFMSQIKNQDPLSPMKSENFAQQMAMFSQLEQSMNTNKTLEKMAAQQSNSQIAALQLVGKDVSADKAALYHDKNKATGFNFQLPKDATDVKVEVMADNGDVVSTVKLGTRSAGKVEGKWDGVTNDGRYAESGRYTYRIVGKDSGGKDLQISTAINGRVTGITSSQGVVFLLVGDQRIALNEIETIREPKDAAKDGVKDPTKDSAKADASKDATSVSKASGTETEPKKTDDGEESEKQPSTKVSVSDSAKDSLSAKPSTQENWIVGDKINPLMPISLR